MEEFTFLLYGYAKDISMNVVLPKMVKKIVRENDKLTKKSKVDLPRIPRARTNSFRTSRESTTAWQGTSGLTRPFPEGQGWESSDQDGLQLIRSMEPVLPTTMVNLQEPIVKHMGGKEEEEDGEEYIEFNALTDDDEDYVCFSSLTNCITYMVEASH